MADSRRAHVAVALIGLTVSAVFGYLAVRGIDWTRFRAALSHADYYWLFPSLIVLMIGVFLRAVRWRLLFPREARPPLGATARALLVGTFFNNILPGRPGEAIRVITLHRDADTPRPIALGTALTERLYDVLVLLALFFAAVPWLPHVTWLHRAEALALALTVGLLVMLAILVRWEVRPVAFVLRPLARFRSFPAARVEHVAEGLVGGLAAMRQPRLALPALAVSFMAILTIGCSFWLLMPAFHLHVGFGAALLVMVATNLAMIIPSSPAAIGVFEATTVAALAPYHVNQAAALSYAVIAHALNVIPFIAFGVLILPRYGIEAFRQPAPHPRG